MPNRWTEAEAQALLAEIFAPWVQDLNLQVTAITETGLLAILPADARLSRGGGEGGGVVCGQAIGAAADTASVLALAALNGRFRPCTTVDLTTHFMRPLAEGDVEIEVTALSNGRRMATTRAELRSPGGKIAATATCAFAYLDG